jgi:hypothetical protein
MNAPEHFTIVGEGAEYRPGGPVAVAQAVRLITSAIAWAREQGVGKLLVVVPPLTPAEPPSLGARYFFVREWADAARGKVTLALVVPVELIDPKRFGVTVARNSGFRANIFATEREARAWLAEQAASESR